MRADRLLTIMMLLQNRGKLTVKELASEVEVSERTILRDMDSLSLAGIPVVSERGKNGGWRLLDNFRSKLSGLTKDEMTSLFLMPSDELLEDLGLDVLDVRQKLLAAIPNLYRNEAEAMGERIYIDTSTWRNSKEKSQALQKVQKALWENRKLSIEYQQPDGELKERLVEPLGLVAQGNKWYLVASREGNMRNYRVSRIQAVRLNDEYFERPEGFHLAAYWLQSKRDFIQSLPSYGVQVEMDPTIINRIMFTGKFVQVMDRQSPNENQWVPATLQFNDYQEAIQFVLGFSDKIKVISPEDLPNRIVSSAKAVINFYENRDE
ncbi:helix-turn-helix transcriptional regulator [Sutcliffiella rhizosphaerae]|uniref:HTH deoR-type domain-containing protein n=1 Tax=Sutcliffiella rhizosphaerae TaxID=2880967 RepID=A0ABM8YT75_9BACI|nr:YafY family protein [Sutcliffiella rhizosphaerae]CAG9623229.1 hypothetical protein BACCIP111883_04025 [Sutcliffiella rhizosphaerae]